MMTELLGAGLLEGCLTPGQCSVEVGCSYVSKGCPRWEVKIQLPCIFQHNLSIVISLNSLGSVCSGKAENLTCFCGILNSKQQIPCSFVSLEPMPGRGGMRAVH